MGSAGCGQATRNAASQASPPGAGARAGAGAGAGRGGEERPSLWQPCSACMRAQGAGVHRPAAVPVMSAARRGCARACTRSAARSRAAAPAQRATRPGVRPEGGDAPAGLRAGAAQRSMQGTCRMPQAVRRGRMPCSAACSTQPSAAQGRAAACSAQRRGTVLLRRPPHALAAVRRVAPCAAPRRAAPSALTAAAHMQQRPGERRAASGAWRPFPPDPDALAALGLGMASSRSPRFLTRRWHCLISSSIPSLLSCCSPPGGSPRRLAPASIAAPQALCASPRQPAPSPRVWTFALTFFSARWPPQAGPVAPACAADGLRLPHAALRATIHVLWTGATTPCQLANPPPPPLTIDHRP